MTANRLERLYRSGPSVVYLRVSTPKQKKSNYKNQITAIRKAIPKLRLTAPDTTQRKEVMSGKADIKKRIGGQLGSAIRQMKRDPDMIMFVSEFDRIGRITEVFEMLQVQGLGHRIYAASCGKSLTEMMVNGDHHRIVVRTQAKDISRQRGTDRFLANGGILGNPDIGKISHKGTTTQRNKAKDRFEFALSILKENVLKDRDRLPAYQFLCDELNERGVRTGQGRMFTPSSLSQLLKGKKKLWDHAKDSFHRPRRRIRKLVKLAIQQTRYRYIRKKQKATISPLALVKPIALYIQTIPRATRPPVGLVHHKATYDQDGTGRCRGPPKVL